MSATTRTHKHTQHHHSNAHKKYTHNKHIYGQKVCPVPGAIITEQRTSTTHAHARTHNITQMNIKLDVDTIQKNTNHT